MDTILYYIELLKAKVATQTDGQKLLLTSAAAGFAATAFLLAVLAFYWDGKDYIISMDTPHQLMLKKETDSGHNAEDPTHKGSGKENQGHDEKQAH